MGVINYTTAKINDLLKKVEEAPEKLENGKTPVFITGTTTTLDPGMSATAEVVLSGTDLEGNPQYKINLGVPKGLDGAGGGGGGVADSVQWANVLNKPVWLNRSTKPTYTATEVGALPSTTIIPSKVSQLTNDRGYLTSSGFKTINGQSIVGSGNISITSGGGTTVTSTAWADITGKPAWIGSSKPTYTASEVGALPSSTTIPTKTSQLSNDSGYTTSTSFKTINGHSIVGSGNIVIESSGGGGTPSGEGGNVKVTNASGLDKDNYYAFKPSAYGSVEGTFSVIPMVTTNRNGLMFSSDYEKLDNMKPVIALPIAVLGYNAETTSETIEAMLKTAFGESSSNITAIQFIYIASVLQGEYNSSFRKYYIGDRECMLGGNVVTDGSSVSQATLEFSYVDGGKLHTVAITMVVSVESGNETYTYSAKVLESGDDTYYLPIGVAHLNAGATKAEIDEAFGGEGKFKEALKAGTDKKKVYIYSSSIGTIPVSVYSIVGSAGYISFMYKDLSNVAIILFISGITVNIIYPEGYKLSPSLYTLTSSSTTDDISTAVGGESGLKAIIQAVKDGNRLFFKATSENDLVTFVYPYSVIYSVSDNGDMTFAFGYCMYAIFGFSNIGFVINYTKSSNTFTCDKTTA